MSISRVKQEYFVIVNPNAGNGKGKKDWNRIQAIFERENIKISHKFTGAKGDAIQITRDAIASGFRKIVSVGGDGTLNEIVNGVFTQEHCSSLEITIGMIPVGTGNDWGRMFGIPLLYEGSVKLISENKVMAHDIGLLKYYDGTTEKKRYFINIAGFGFEAVVVKKSNKQKDKGRSNPAVYFFNLLSSLVTYSNASVNLTIDGYTTQASVFSVNVGNGRYCGGGMRQTPDAMPDDGVFDVTVIKDMGRIEIIRNLKILYDGTILSHPKVDGYRAKNIRVESEEELFAEADGESLGHTPLEFSIIPAGLNVIYGSRIIR